MPRGDLPALVRLDIADDPEVWERLGFAVDAPGTVRIGGVVVRLVGRAAGEGIVGWGLDAPGALPAQVDGIPTDAAEHRPAAAPVHPNGAGRVDHVVVATPDLDRTLAALAELGLAVSRERATGTDGPRARQAFVWSGDVILEVVGPRAPSGTGPASLWGLVAVTEDVDALEALTGGAVAAARDAVQPGRRIAPVTAQAGSSTALAFMTPHVRPARST